MTERLYYRDAMLLAFDAVAVEHVGDAQHVVLDRTAFYPTSGGQPHDVGHLGAAHVVDVIDGVDRIVHVLDAPLMLGPIRGEIDAERRRDHMQQHTAQHLLSALAGDRFDWDTVSVHFGEMHSSIEFAVPEASGAQVGQLERWSNDVTGEAREVSVGFEDAVAAGRTGLRKPSGRTGEIRVITIADLDRSACGGTHVSRTSEIGSILLLGVEKIRGHVRIGFVAGGRVILHARSNARMLAAVARKMGCAVNEIETLIPARQQELKALRDQVAILEQEVAVARVARLVDATAPGPDGVRRILHRPTDASPAVLRSMAQAINSQGRVVFAAIAMSPPTIYFATSADSGVNAGAVLKQALAAVGGRGGGSARMAQGTAATIAAAEAVAIAVVQP
ncbi:MAG: alanyl-tRNA editing protein [Gemmatimonadales bacterium]